MDWCSLWSDVVSNEPDETYWNRRAPKYPGDENYGIFIMQQLNIVESDCVADVGCGTGRLSIPLSAMVKRVIAIDSSNGMIDMLKKRIKMNNIDNIEVINSRWEDVKIDGCDVVIFMHSFVMRDGCHALKKALDVAKREVYIIKSVQRDVFWKELYTFRTGKKWKRRNTLPYLINIILKLGYVPEIKIVEYRKNKHYNSVDDMADDAARILGWDELTAEEMEFLKAKYTTIGGYSDLVAPVILKNAVIRISKNNIIT